MGDWVQTEAVTRLAMAVEDLEANVNHAFTLGLPSLEQLPGYQRSKGMRPLSLLAGGPSVKNTLKDAEGDLMVCGSAHDYVVSQGVKPKYAVMLDGDPCVAGYLKNPCKDTIYLVASQCDPSVFERLKDHTVYTWNCAGGVGYRLFDGQIVVGGGSTVTLRATSLALLLGYTNVHIHGFDSCYLDGEHHAYATEEVKAPNEVRLGGENGKAFLCAPYHISQAKHFQTFLKNFGHMMNITVHGPGMIAEIMRMGNEQAKAMTEEEVNTKGKARMEKVFAIGAIVDEEFIERQNREVEGT